MRIAVLISGGVDSAVVVHRLKEAGHDLTLFYIRIGMDTGEGDCSAEEDIEMCTSIARRYGLPLEVVSLHEEYWENVMEYALRTVESGLTPNPDMMCNKMIKFGYFEQRFGKGFREDRDGALRFDGFYRREALSGDGSRPGEGPDRFSRTDFLRTAVAPDVSHRVASERGGETHCSGVEAPECLPERQPRHLLLGQNQL